MPWVRYDDGFADHPKVLAAVLADPGSLSLHVLGGCWSATTATPGIVTLAAAVAKVGSRAKAARWAGILVDVGLWHTTGHHCRRCPQPPEDAFAVHDWEVTNPPRDLSEVRAEAGRKGAEARWRGHGKPAQESQRASQTHGKRMAENAPGPVPVPTPEDKVNPISSTTAVIDVVREDVERICSHFAERMVGNGCKRPTITRAWRDDARLMLDKDGRTEANVHAAIDWCQSDPFWRGNVLSLPTLRKQYDRLSLAAQRGSNGRSATDDVLAREFARVQTRKAGA